MTIQSQESLTPHLPALRRYARAVTGDQQHGDAAVADLKDAADLPLSALLRRLDVSLAGGNDQDKALLLHNALGLPLSDIAAILGRECGEVGEMIEESITAKPGKSLRILIVEAEPDVGSGLKGVLERQGHAVVDIVPTCLKALDIRRQKPLDLVIADLQLADGCSGLDAARQLLGAFDVPVICLTAFPERLLTGEGLEPAFIVQKPYSPDLIATMVRQAEVFTRRTPLAM